MKFSLLSFLLLTLVCVLLLGVFPSCNNQKSSKDKKNQESSQAKQPALSPSIAASVLRVTSTIQQPDLLRPWLKRQPYTRSGLGTVIDGGRLLVTADMVDHATYIELEKPEDGPKSTASIVAIDRECNLAVIKPTDPAMLSGTHPLQLDTKATNGSSLRIVQLEENGSPAFTPATVTSVGTMPYPADNAYYLGYRTSTTIPQRNDSFVLPALSGDNLAGLVMRYDPKTQSADIIPAPLIERFLKESAKPTFRGLAKAGLGWSEIRGTTLREWLGAGKTQNGVYVTWLEPDGPAEKAGIHQGDLLLKVAGHSIDGEGNYLDPVYGKITFNNLESLELAPGDQIDLSYFRTSGEGKGTTNTATVTLEGSQTSSEISPSRIDGDTVPYTFLGSLLFLELSRPYLREWGGSWQREAPQNLVYLDAFQHELPRDRGHIVVLSSLLPSAQTVGFQDLGKRVVTSINNREIRGLNDVIEAAKHPINGFHKIMLEGSAGPVYLDAATCGADEASVRAQYGIPTSRQSRQGS